MPGTTKYLPRRWAGKELVSMAARRTQHNVVPVAGAAGAHVFAGLWGPDRKGARIRSVILNPVWSGVREDENGFVRYPLVEMGIGNGGHGGEVRLKLWLSMIYRVVKEDDWIVLRRNNHANYASMFGLADPAGKGADRVRDAYRWLHQNRFIVIEGGRLKTYGRVRVTHELTHFLPADFPLVMRPAPRGLQDIDVPSIPHLKHRYFNLPRPFWENGWITYMRASEILVLMILCDAARNNINTEIRIPVHERMRRYGLSDEMWKQGETGLETRGIIGRPETTGRVLEDYGWGHADAERVYRFNGPTPDAALRRELDAVEHTAIRGELVR